MGGWGSGRHGGRPTADSCLRIDLAWMLRSGFAKEGCRSSGTLHWSRGGKPSASIGYTAHMDVPSEERLELSYTRGSGDKRESVEQTIRLTFTRPHYGGKRWWMICPFRNVRIGKLYLPNGGDRFASREAWRLGYHIQRVAHRDRPFEALFRLQRKLGAREGWEAGIRRPKGMWDRTYQRHWERYWELDAQCGKEMMGVLASLKRRMEPNR